RPRLAALSLWDGREGGDLQAVAGDPNAAGRGLDGEREGGAADGDVLGDLLDRGEPGAVAVLDLVQGRAVDRDHRGRARRVLVEAVDVRGVPVGELALFRQEQEDRAGLGVVGQRAAGDEPALLAVEELAPWEEHPAAEAAL